LLLLVLLLSRRFVDLMSTNDASRRRSKHAVMAGKVPRSAADGRSLQASFRVRRRNSKSAAAAMSNPFIFASLAVARRTLGWLGRLQSAITSGREDFEREQATPVYRGYAARTHP
jgi:hypothetical protein